MKRFSLKFLLLLVTIAALLVWWLDSGYREIYRENLATHGELVIFGRKSREPKQVLIKVRFTPKGAKKDSLRSIPAVCLEKAADYPSFRSITDKTSGLWCVFDNENTDFVFLAYPSGKVKGKGSYAFWHPGVHLGWGRGFWADRYKTLRSLNPILPYRNLPSDRPFVSD